MLSFAAANLTQNKYDKMVKQPNKSLEICYAHHQKIK